VSDSLNPPDNKTQIFATNVLGFQTHRDDFAVSFDSAVMTSRIRDMRDETVSNSTFRERHNISGDGWRLDQARSAVSNMSGWEDWVVPCSYRPFDTRACFFDSSVMDRPRKELTDHVVHHKNVLLLTSRQIATEHWRHVATSDLIAESCYISDGTTEQNYCFPLWLYGDGARAHENLSPNFRAFVDARYDHHYSPEEILGYIYAVLHAPTYRSLYAEFLRIDFPRIPFAEHAADFEVLSTLGWQLVQAHLLKSVPRQKLAQFHGRGDQSVEKVAYVEADHSVRINANQWFAPVPREVWEFHIGGHQVLDKYLKSRKSRTLSLDEINHVSAVADSLAFTIAQMRTIDAAYRAAFPEQGTSESNARGTEPAPA
jgi:predicted helicase